MFYSVFVDRIHYMNRSQLLSYYFCLQCDVYLRVLGSEWFPKMKQAPIFTFRLVYLVFTGFYTGVRCLDGRQTVTLSIPVEIVGSEQKDAFIISPPTSPPDGGGNPWQATCRFHGTPELCMQIAMHYQKISSHVHTTS